MKFILNALKHSHSKNEIIAETSRVEAYSDAIIAIIMTLLVFQLVVPEYNSADKIMTNIVAFKPLIPFLASFAFFFVTLAVIWINHHHFFHDIKGVDKHILWHNNHVLFWICMVPFVTAVIGKHFGDHVATAIYGMVMFMMSFGFTLMTRYAFFKCDLLPNDIPLKLREKQYKRSMLGPLLYFIGVGFAFFVPWVSVALYLSVILFYFLPQRVGDVMVGVEE